MGDVIPYIFCLGSGGESSKTGQAERARHPDEVRKADKDCQIGMVPHPFLRVVPLTHWSLNSVSLFLPENRLRLLLDPADIATNREIVRED